jgi:hypothetical protein
MGLQLHLASKSAAHAPGLPFAACYRALPAARERFSSARWSWQAQQQRPYLQSSTYTTPLFFQLAISRVHVALSTSQNTALQLSV